jgi:hypothetical protein
MGVRASLREISATTFMKLQAGEKLDEDDLIEPSSAFLDIFCRDFHVMFKQADSPLRYIFDGDFPHPSSAANIDDYLMNTASNYFVGFVSPDLVKEIADALPRLTNTYIKRLAQQAGIIWQAYHEGYIQEIKDVYIRAARNGSALCVTIA